MLLCSSKSDPEFLSISKNLIQNFARISLEHNRLLVVLVCPVVACRLLEKILQPRSHVQRHIFPYAGVPQPPIFPVCVLSDLNHHTSLHFRIVQRATPTTPHMESSSWSTECDW